ncbi:hypothetical protein UA70_30105, partial [Raoultella planticola]
SAADGQKGYHDNASILAALVKLLPFKGQSSVNAAKAALSTWRQQPDKFWALHQRLMAKRATTTMRVFSPRL